ncbi:MAG TPA: hypothetical protein VJA21_15015 [Verrucomicrobiae bacterium]
MGKFVKFFSVAIGAMALCFLLGSWRDREPTYKGLTMGQWLRKGDLPEATEALLILGTNNLPLLIQRLEFASEGDLMMRALNRLPSKVSYSSFMNNFTQGHRSHLFRQEQLSRDAYAILIKLGTNAAPAIPQLVNIAQRRKLPASGRARAVLPSLGKDGQAAAASMARSTNTFDEFEGRWLLSIP